MINSKFLNMVNKFKKEKAQDCSQKFIDEKKVIKDYSDKVSFKNHPLYQKMKTMESLADTFKIKNPFFKLHENPHNALTTVNGKECINYSSYDYLGLNEHPKVREDAIQAIREYGTSVGASRLVAGERLFQRDLEKKLASLYHKDDAIVFVSGHATNVSVISTLFGSKDLIIYDALDHNSIIEGIKLSGAKYFPFTHNNLEILENLLKNNRDEFERVLIVTEGLFSMDGDIPNLPELIRIKKEYGCVLMIDEAHALGVLGVNGTGISEFFNVAEDDVDIWMGTLSKTLASCGGYIASSQEIVDILKCNAPGFVFSVGMSAPKAYAALRSLEILETEKDRVQKLQNNSQLFLKLAKEQCLNVGNAVGYAVIPVITGSSHKAIKLSSLLFEEGINVQPIIHPAVEEKQARLRFFITSKHTEDQIRYTCQVLGRICKKEGFI